MPGAVAWGGVISGAFYMATTLILLLAIGKSDISILQGIVQAVGHMAQRVGVAWISIPFAVMLSLAIAGIGSAWTGGAARIPFVAGLDSYMPSWMGKIHPKYATPHAALIVQFVVSGLLVVINFVGGWMWNQFVSLGPMEAVWRILGIDFTRVIATPQGVQETFQRLLSLAVVLHLVAFLDFFAA